MWTRAELKTRAKQFYANNVFAALIVSLVLRLVTSNGNGSRNQIQSGDVMNERLISWPAVGTIVSIVLIAILIRIVIGYLLEVGARHYYLKGTHTDVRMGELGYAFKRNDKRHIIWTLLWRDIKIILWTFLLIIPGIIKSYAYAMTPYIVAEHPELTADEVHALSSEMTDGHKMKMFVLDLSFIGWYILGLLALGIGILFVNPYVDATHAQLYQKLKQLYRGGSGGYSIEPIDFYSDF